MARMPVGGMPATTDCRCSGDPVTNRPASERTAVVSFPGATAPSPGRGAPEALTVGAGGPPTNTTGARRTRNGNVAFAAFITSLLLPEMGASRPREVHRVPGLENPRGVN